MLRTVFESTSNSRITGCAHVALPYSVSKDLPSFMIFKTEDDKRLRAYRRLSIGTQTQLWDVEGKWEPNVKVIGEFVNPEQLEMDMEAALIGLELSDWIEADLIHLIPQPVITLFNGDVIRPAVDFQKTKLININNLVMEFDIQYTPVEGVIFECNVTIHAKQDHVEFDLGYHWSDRNDSTYSKTIVKVEMENRSPFVIHNRARYGIAEPVYYAQINTWTTALLNQHILRDAQGANWQGYILAHPLDYMTDDMYNAADTQERLAVLEAIKNGNEFFGGVGEVWGICEDLNINHDWLCFGRNADIPTLSDPYMPNPIYGIGIWAPRQVGMSQTPSQTGGQEDFGSDKGSPATVLHMPSWITYFRAALTDPFRFFHQFEANGDPLMRLAHIGRTTWDMETHDATTRDTIGKTKGAPRPSGNGYRGYDNQHRSQNGLLTWYALTGNRMIKKTLKQCVETDLAQVPNRAGAEREIGRLFLTWSKFIKVLDTYDANRILDLMLSKHNNVKNQWRGRFFQNDPTRSVRVLQVELDDRSGVKDPTTGLTTHAWIPYQTAMMVLGYYALYKVTNNPDILDICKQLAKTVISHGVFKDENNHWQCLTFCRYRTGLAQGISIPSNTAAPEEGLPLDTSSYRVGSPEITISNSFWAWMLPAFIVGREILDEPDLKARAQEVLDYVYPDKYPDWSASEWMACGDLRKI